MGTDSCGESGAGVLGGGEAAAAEEELPAASPIRRRSIGKE